MVEKTNVYFLAEITRNFGNGDCILLENIDSYGNIVHVLVIKFIMELFVNFYKGIMLKN